MNAPAYRTRIDPTAGRVFKCVASPEQALWLVDTSRRLRQHGVTTPNLSREGLCSVSAPLIPGDPAPDLYRRLLSEHGCWSAMPARRIASLIEPLICIHTAHPTESIPRLDPFKRIRPRLLNLRSRLTTERAETLARIIDQLITPYELLKADAPASLLHGDYHIGQLIVSDRIWVVDLDDVCTGPREYDLANFCAHLGSSPQFGRMSSSEHRDLLDRFVRIYSSGCVGQPPLAESRIDLFLTTSLVRRYLKLVETEGDEVWCEHVWTLTDFAYQHWKNRYGH